MFSKRTQSSSSPTTSRRAGSDVAISFPSYYFDDAVQDLPRVIDEAQAGLRGVDFDTLVGTGFSGSIVIPALAMAMEKKFALIRKETDDSHHGKGKLVGQLGERWIFVDDFILTGATRERVIRKISENLMGFKVTMVGQYMYMSRAAGMAGFTAFDEHWVAGGQS